MIDRIASDIAKKAHEGQKDLGENDYFNSHLFYVASRFKDPIIRAVGFLHDILEDTNYTEDRLREELVSGGANEEDVDRIIEAVLLLTKKKGESYSEYINKIKQNELARKVKIVDMTQNSDLSRLKKVGVKDIIRKNKYRDSINKLKG